MTRVVIFSTFYEPFMSGAERMVKEVVERLQERYSFIIVTSRLRRNLPQFVEVEHRRTLQRAGASERRRFDLDDSRIKIVRIGFGWKFDKFLYPILAPFYALRYRPKIVHAIMESYAGIALLVYSYLAKLSKPLILNSQFLILTLRRRSNLDALCSEQERAKEGDSISHKNVFTILTLQSGDLDLPEKQARIPRWLWKRIHCAPNLIVSIGNSMAERARKLGAKSVRVIPNGVNLTEVRPPNIRRSDLRQHHIVCVARLSPEKGIEYLIEAMPFVIAQYPDAELVLVGNGALREKLQATSYKLQAHVEFRGTLSHEKTLEEMATSDILVLPSLAEGMGIVLVEAQALGVPVIGTNVGGIPDVIEHERTGLLVPPHDPRAIAQAVIRLFHDHELRERMVVEAETRLLKFDWQKIAEEYRNIYDQVSSV